MFKLLYIGFIKKAIIFWIKKKLDRIRKGLLRIYLIKLKTFRGICTLLKYRIIKNALTVCVLLRYVESGSVIFWYPNTGFKCGSGLTPKWSESWFLKVRSAILLYIHITRYSRHKRIYLNKRGYLRRTLFL